MIDIEFATALPKAVGESELRDALKHFAKALKLRPDISVGVAFVPPKRMRELNNAYRGKDRETDVLAFAPESQELPKAGRDAKYLGDIVICPSYAKKEAKRRGIPPGEELIRLFVHGLLHLKGHGHTTEEEETDMFSLQEKIVAQNAK